MDHAFQYKTTPFNHQRNIFEQTRDYQYYALFWEMGTGKSKVVIDTAQWLFVNEKIDSIIITAEKGYYLNWILNEFPTHWPEHLPVRVTVWSSYTTKAKKDELANGLVPVPGVLDILIVNIESLSGKNMGGSKYTEQFRDAHSSTMMVVDESTTIKSPTAGRTKQCIAIGKRCQYRRILTGTPITQSPIDLFAQCEFLKLGVTGFKSFTSFRAYYSIMQPMQIGYNRQIMQTVGYRELDDLARRVQPFSSRLLKADCLDLPDKVYAPIYVESTDEQDLHNNLLKKAMMTNIGQGLVTVENALSVLTKTLQIAGGHCKDDEGNVQRVKSNKPERLKQLIEDLPAGTKAIVWGYFQEDMQIIQETLKGVCPVYEVSGRVDGILREQNIRNFRDNEKTCVFLASPRVAGKSLTLVEATVSIYYSNGFNLEHRLQSEDRNHRIGQRNKVTYYDLICLNSPDVKVVQALKAKEVVSRQVLDKIEAFFDYQVAL